MTTTVSIEAIRNALTFIPADDRALWLRVGMALKSEVGDTGFDMFEAWSQSAENFDAKAVKSSWKSFKPGGGVTIGTLIAEAKQRGFNPKRFAAPILLSSDERARIKDNQAERERSAAAEIVSKHAVAADEAARLWSAASGSGASPYLLRKGVQCFGVRFNNDVILIPLVDDGGKLWNLQRVFAKGEKRFLSGGRVSGCFHLLGEIQASDWLLIAEGYATGATLHEATGHPVVIAFNESNLKHVATAMRKLYPDAKLMLCADDDRETEAKTGKNPGKAAAHTVSEKVNGFWCTPIGLPDGGTDFNDLAGRDGIDIVRQQVAAAIDAVTPISGTVRPVDDIATDANGKGKKAIPDKSSRFKKPAINPQSSRAAFFAVDDRGVWHHGFSQQGEALPAQWICSALQVTAKSRDANNGAWGYLLEFADSDGNAKRWAMPASMLAGDGNLYRQTLLDMGLQIGAGMHAKNHLTVYIQTQQTDVRVRCTDRIGWHDDVYVLPDNTIGAGDEIVMFQSPGGIVSQFKQRGTLEQWRDEVAALCRGNSRMLFCVSAAFAAPLLHHSGIASGGFHIWGDSSSGKSTAFKVAGSVYGGKDYPRNWRMTDNALEMVAAQHSDALLLLDEIAQVDPKVVGDTVYMLANETGKGRATQTATARKVHTWRVLFLSDGEVSLANHMSEAGKGTRGGHDVRMVHITADAGKGFGVYDTLNDFATGAALSDHLVKMSHQYYGVAGLAFIEWAVARAEKLPDALRSRVHTLASELVPTGAHGQVSRVAARFALVGVAGELATGAGITGWPPGEAISAARTCFADWLASRGGVGNVEHISIVRQVRNFMSLHGEARFVWVQRILDDHKPVTMHRAGFKRMMKQGDPINSKTDYHHAFGNEAPSTLDADTVDIEYLVSPDVFRGEICKGFDHKAVAKLLVARGHLTVDSEGRADKRLRIPGVGNTRAYCIQSSIFNGDD